MVPDAVTARELKSLHEEVLAAQRERAGSPVTPPHISVETPEPGAAPIEPEETADTREARDQLHDLTNEVTRFLEEAEKGISAHPAQSVVGALLVGILIGRLLGRR